jgi:glycerol-1-phosphate dehydrogenase [NAD(P)+]
MDNKIKNLLSGKVLNPVTGKKISIPIKEIQIDGGIIKNIPAFCKKHDLGLRVAIVSDENTHLETGAEVERTLSLSGFEVFSIVLPGDARADNANIEMLSTYIASADFSVAVGSGTISDLTKYASYLMKRKYICVPTAPSVNGYSSANASIDVDGVKKSLQAHLPYAIFMDIDVQVQAPYRLIIAGLGDALARSTAQTDWLMSHLILGTEYNPLPFELLADDEKIVFDNAEKLVQRDFDTLAALSRLSILSGFGMYLAGGSYPASQGEHLVHHYMEMMFDGKYTHTFHGEQIAVTSIACAKLQEDILSLKKLEIHPTYYNEKPVMKHFGQERGAQFLSELANKEISDSRAREINLKLKAEWPMIKKQISDVHINSAKLEEIIKKVRGPYTYKHLGWEHKDFENAVRNALFMRSRFTFLDLAMISKRELN